VLLSAAPSFNAFQQTGTLDAPPCEKALEAASDALQDISALHTRVVRNRIDRAVMLFRAGKVKEAGASLDFALALLDLTRKRLMSFEERERVHQAVDELRHCIDTSTAPAMATLTVRTYEQDDRAADGRADRLNPGRSCASTRCPWGAPALAGSSRERCRPDRCA